MSAPVTRVVFMGTPEFAVPSLEALVLAGYQVVGVYSQPDRAAGRHGRLQAPPVKLAAEQLGLRVLQPPSLRKRETVDELRSLRPDLIVVAAFGQILRPVVLETPPHGCLNIHASLLPRHRGASPIAAAILAGDRETGVTLMQMDPGLDTGPMLQARTVPIERNDTTGTLTDKLSRLGGDLLIEALPAWLAGTLQAAPQDDSAATYAPLLEKEAGRIDWSKTAERIWREVRAYNPWPVSAALLGGEPLQILEAEWLPESFGDAEPGMIVPLPADALPTELRRRAAFAVATGEGLLAPLTVRRAGRNAVSAAEFARGVRDLLGRHLE